MYIMGLGGKPIGECYLTPPDETGTWIKGQYYNGGEVKLIKFQSPLSEPQEGSLEKRVRDLEDWAYCMEKYVEYMFEKLCDVSGVEYKSFDIYKSGIGSIPSHNANESDMPYVITNVDNWR